MSTAGRALKPPINGEEKLPPPTGIVAVPPPSKSTIALGKKMSGHQLICRIEAIFNVVQEAAAGAHAGLERSPAEQLEYVVRRLDPIEKFLDAPLERFGADVEELAELLRSRDTDAESKLSAIRYAVGRALERGRFGALDDLIPADMEEKAAKELRRKQELAEKAEQERWEKMRKQQQQERKESEEVLDDLFFSQHDRMGEREQLMGQVGARQSSA